MSITRRTFLALGSSAGVGLAVSRSLHAQAPAPTSRDMQRADELLHQMTIEEKAMQLSCVMPLALLDRNGLMRGQADTLIKQGIGHVAGIGAFGHKSPEEVARSVNAIQRYLVTDTRLKIPAIFHNEALNGVVAPHFSAFPTPIGLAATWDPAAVQEMADIMRRQACCTRSPPSWTWRATPAGGVSPRPTAKIPIWSVR